MTLDSLERAPIFAQRASAVMETDTEPAVHRRGRRLPRLGIEADVNVHIFSVSAALVGVCLTVIGIIRIGVNLAAGYSTYADRLLAVDAICFMGSCLLAYSSLRSPVHARSKRFEGFADRLFVTGMATMCLACTLIAFSIV